MFRTRFIPVFALAAMMSLAFAADDQEFVKDATVAGMFEVKAGKLATEKGGDQVKGFGAQMVADHGTANDELKALADKKGWTLPTAMDEKHQGMFDKLNGLNQPDFDREYIGMMKDGHTKVRDAFKTASESASDADLKAFAAKTLPTIEAHLKHVQGMSGAASANLPPPTDPNAVTTTDPNRTYDTSVNRFQNNQPVPPNQQAQVTDRTFNDSTFTQNGETAPIPTRYYTLENGQYVELNANHPMYNDLHECCCRN